MLASLRGLDRQRRRCAHGHDRGEPGRPRLLHDLERCPTAHGRARGRSPAARSSSSRRPTTLSTALCRPTSSRTTMHLAVAIERRRGVHRTGRCRTALAARRARSGTCASTVERERLAGRPADRAASTSSSIDCDPHSPHDDVVVVSRGVGTGASAAGLDAHHVELGLDRGPGAAVAARLHGRAGQQSVGEAEPDGQLEVVARRAHGGRDQRVVETDLERLLDDQLVGSAAVSRPSKWAVITFCVRPRAMAQATLEPRLNAETRA